MKSARQPVSNPAKATKKRKRRARPTPRWLKEPPTDGPEAVAQRRCLLILSVLSGEQPVTDAIEATGVSRQLYYQLEERALKAMLHSLLPTSEGREDVETSLAERRPARHLRRAFEGVPVPRRCTGCSRARLRSPPSPARRVGLTALPANEVPKPPKETNRAWLMTPSASGKAKLATFPS